MITRRVVVASDLTEAFRRATPLSLQGTAQRAKRSPSCSLLDGQGLKEGDSSLTGPSG